MEKTKELTSVQARVVREIVALVRREKREAGSPLAEVALAEAIGTSRSPVQVALRHLSELGLVHRDANRRFVLTRAAQDLDEEARTLLAEPDDPLYDRIARARQAGELPDEVSEAQLMRLFGVARSTLRKVLSRIAKEGWVEQRVGNGWLFLPMIDSPQAYEESYLFRQSIEPAAILSPWFTADRNELQGLILEQRFIVDGGYQTMTAIELFEANCHFHETLAKWSGNRFVLQAIQRLNELRRLVEYRQASARTPRRAQAEEHLAILAAIQTQDLIEAAGLMRKHLEDARRAKVYGQSGFSAKEVQDRPNGVLALQGMEDSTVSTRERS
ncbi:GntR family transcriptional regulator [Achromobacter sp. UMC71]|uniref:GntR family transcriptional regulator n=1 Tax=Achromobacter sp. UMC71 TaxID=1862320 RepID=UPI0016015451|nr:GntR family transcriptional regulator [Achromobacter sp. UMC71]MBB1625968.1 GntR family transcriptional regulator [Achromobacter sp. UMC71]MBB1628314.1 GntR family transcriptional regulator [Achromobacter sp. UMC71]